MSGSADADTLVRTSADWRRLDKLDRRLLRPLAVPLAADGGPDPRRPRRCGVTFMWPFSLPRVTGSGRSSSGESSSA